MASTAAKKVARTGEHSAPPPSSGGRYSSTFDDAFLRRRKRREQEEEEEEIDTKEGAAGEGGGGGGGTRPKPKSPLKPLSPKSLPPPPPRPLPAARRRSRVPPPSDHSSSSSSSPRTRPLPSSSASSPKNVAPVEPLPAPLADLVFGGLSDDELASLVRRAERPYEYVGHATQHGREEKKPGAAPASSRSASRTVAEFRPRPYAPSSPKLSEDLDRSFASLRTRCRSTCAQQWRQVVAERLRQIAASDHESESKGESERDQEASDRPVSLPICARLCAADIEPVIELVQAYRDELRALVASGDAHASDRTVHGVTYATPNAWELGYQPFLRFHSSAQNALGVPFHLGVEMRAETDTRRPEPERLRLVVETDFARERLVWNAERQEWIRSRGRTDDVGAAAKQNAARRAWRTFVIGDVARTTESASAAAAAAPHDTLDFVSTGSNRYEWVGPDNARTWREFARVIALVQWAATPATLYVTPSPQDWEGARVPSPLPRYLRLVRTAFPELPVVVQYVDDPAVVPQREPHGSKIHPARLRVPGDHIARIVASARVSNVVAQRVPYWWP